MGVADLERLESILSTCKHLTDCRLLLALSKIVHWFVHFDRRAECRGLYRADQMPSKTNTGLEEICMALYLMRGLVARGF